eukprot:CAMPEP_0118661674 /NCGR_PEP_ID=MMETSP0785-20121206/16418_1 /TAXON_ID=91992 /ORGANISM="Bolidomonas pacifica, Strain CCMP 1866" /LENGTH=612 /DNA_ID=CAMNT_0006555155 /DNA_START=131 /DNA_END=1965 /DNA_ORIENTATION=+
MDLLSGYGSDNSDNEPNANQTSAPIPTASTILRLNANPSVSLAYQGSMNATSSPKNTSTSLVVAGAPTASSKLANADRYAYNPSAPLPGPTPAPVHSGTFKQTNWNTGSVGAAGVYEKVAYDGATFDFHYDQYNSTGKTEAPGGGGTITEGDGKLGIERHTAIKRPSVMNSAPIASGEEPPKKKKKKKNKGPYVATDDDLEGDDGQFGIFTKPSQKELDLMEDSMTSVQKGELQEFQLQNRDEIEEKEKAKAHQLDDDNDTSVDRMLERKLSHLLPPRMAPGAVAGPSSTTFHGSSVRDYQGRSWIHPPSGVRPSDDHKCYVPTRCAGTIKNAHSKGVHAVRFFPGTGHLLLSAGLDGVVKVWDVKRRKVMRTYKGHTAAVRDVAWNGDGTRFVSVSYDRWVRLWDTETGECIKTFTTRRVPYCCKFYPLDDNFFVVGQSDNRVVCYDVEKGTVCQEYNHHLAAVNTVTFTEDAKKMVTTSDDKKVMVWEWDIGVPVKYISEPDMHSMPAVAVHPDGEYMALQSMDNEIKVYAAKDRYQIIRKKAFKGHQAAGFACEISFAASGRYMVGGDGNGRLWVWDWDKGRVLTKFNAHRKGPTRGVEWSPVDPCLVA